MRKYLQTLSLIFAFSSSFAQVETTPESIDCCADSIIINTGYDPIAGVKIPYGAKDSTWIVSAATPTIPFIGTIGSRAYAIERLTGRYEWAENPITAPGGWISCIDQMRFYTDGLGTTYNYILSRPFKTCSPDSIKFTLHIACDNYVSLMDVDSVNVLGFSQIPGWIDTNYSVFVSFTKTVYLPAGSHKLNVLVHNRNNPSDPHMNPTGLNIYGSVSSPAKKKSIVKETTLCRDFIVGVKQHFPSKDEFALEIYPNPTKESSTISYHFPILTTGGEIAIFDVRGKKIKSYPINRNNDHIEIQASGLKAGFYYCQLTANGSWGTTKKLIVTK